MAVVTVRTVRIEGGGSVTCRFCNRCTTFTRSEWLEFIEDGRTLACIGVHEGLVALHDCRRPSLVWQCPACGIRPESLVQILPRRSTRRRRSVLQRCPACGTDLIQVRDSPEG